MKLALLGQGAMGQLVAELARNQGHEIALTLTSVDGGCAVDDLVGALRGKDVGIDFSVAAAVPFNVEVCARAGVPLVEGTTGWQAHLDGVRNTVAAPGVFDLRRELFHRRASILSPCRSRG